MTIVQQDAPCIAWPIEESREFGVKLLPASDFTWEELTDAYNRTRMDYIVPMPMNVARLREYVRNYDVEMGMSVVAMEDDQILGLAMLGVRPGHTWITRLGLIPIRRGRGTGQALMEYLIAQSDCLGVEYVILEVIRGNEPAYRLFKKLGFQEVRELLIMRRPPGSMAGSIASEVSPYEAQVLNYQQVVERLHQRHSIPSWLDETPSLINAGNLAGLQVELENGGRGWITYQNRVFQLSRLVLQTEAGDPCEVGQALLHALHLRHPAQDTNTENVPGDDSHLQAMWDMGYLESFRRIEMRLDLPRA